MTLLLLPAPFLLVEQIKDARDIVYLHILSLPHPVTHDLLVAERVGVAKNAAASVHYHEVVKRGHTDCSPR